MHSPRPGTPRKRGRALTAVALTALAFSAALSLPARAQGAPSPRIPAICAQTAAPAGSSAAERAVWPRLCATGFADLSEGDEAGCAADGGGAWPERRRLSAGFLTSVLLREPWRSARRAAAVGLRCAEIEGALDLSHRRLRDALAIEDSRIRLPVALRGASAERLISFRGSRLEGGVDGEGLRARGDLFLREAVSAAPARFVGARFEGAFAADAARFADGLDLSQARIDGPLTLDRAAIDGGLALEAARLGEGGRFAGLSSYGPLKASDLRSDGPLAFRGARLAAWAGFSRLRASTLDLSGARIEDVLDLRRARIGRLLLRPLDGAGEAARFGGRARATLREARIGALEGAPDLWTTADGAGLPRDLRGMTAERGGWLEAPGAALVAWLEGGFPAEGAFAEERAAYLGLAAALREAGRTQTAREVRYAERRRFLERAELGLFDTALWRLWGATTGFGHRPERAIAWLVGLIGFGAALGVASPRLRRLGAGRLFRLSAENALVWPSFSGQRRRLYRGAAGMAALFALQRLAGAALLAAVLLSALSATGA